MRQTTRWRDLEDDQAGANRQTQSLAGLAITLLLVVVSLGLIQILHRMTAIEDCLLAGRRICGEAIDWPAATKGLPPG